jgi:hypothetical protein
MVGIVVGIVVGMDGTVVGIEDIGGRANFGIGMVGIVIFGTAGMEGIGGSVSVVGTAGMEGTGGSLVGTAGMDG